MQAIAKTELANLVLLVSGCRVCLLRVSCLLENEKRIGINENKIREKTGHVERAEIIDVS